jgi:hypothetical protein
MERYSDGRFKSSCKKEIINKISLYLDDIIKYADNDFNIIDIGIQTKESHCLDKAEIIIKLQVG